MKNSISVEQLRSLLREFNGPLYHIDGAQSIPLSNLSAHLVDLKGEDKKKYYIICKSGSRSTVATQIMKNRGLNAINVSGGMIAWSRLKK